MNCHHPSIGERSCIQKYGVDRSNYREVPWLIGRTVNTVSREIWRNCTRMYDIPAYCLPTRNKKVPVAAFLLSPWNILFSGVLQIKVNS